MCRDFVLTEPIFSKLRVSLTCQSIKIKLERLQIVQPPFGRRFDFLGLTL
jgi:hypothetical protein